MMYQKKITITAVRERSLVIKRGSFAVRDCPKCLTDSPMVKASMAADISRQSLRMICRWVESEQVHYSEESDGLFICLSSMPCA